MKRRSHKKSRGGCLECRRRHIKCDETQGACVNCITAERRCEYRGQSAPAITNHAVDDDASRLVAVAQTPGSVMSDAHESPGDPDINMNHMELLIHFTSTAAIPEMEKGDVRHGTDLILRMSLEAPYLLHQVLAISARHLSVIRPSQAAFYLHQATQLQTRSISIFKSSQLLVDRSTCVPMLLYSSLLGRHLLADVLTNKNPELSLFLDRFVQYVRLHRGVRAIASGSWHLLIESDLRPFIKWGSPPPDLIGKGYECTELKRLVREQSHLNESSLKACQEAIELLQVGFDELNNPHDERNPYSLIFTWTILGPEEFFHLLERRQPEAIAILGYYAALLHRGRHIWQISDSGERLLRSISQHLGPAFAAWLAWPQEIISSFWLTTQPTAIGSEASSH